MANYRLSNKADFDFEQIAIYSEINFGAKVADKYLDDLALAFEKISINPLLYPVYDRGGMTLRKCVCNRHSIYFSIDEGGILIVRIIGKQEF